MRPRSISTASQSLNSLYESKYSSIYHPKNNNVDQSIAWPAVKSQDDYSKLINRLDMVASEHPFAKQRLLLIPGEQQKGYLHEGSFQYFKILVKGKISPLRISITNSTSRLESFVSFKHAFPDEVTSELKYASFSFKVNSSSSVSFSDTFCYVAIRPKSDCKFTINCSFGAEKQSRRALNKIKNKRSHKKYLKKECDLDDSKRKKDMKFMIQNMSYDKMRPKTREEQRSIIQNRSIHSSLVLKRKQEVYHSKKEMLMAKSQSKTIMRLAQLKANQYLYVQRRNEVFSKNWLIVLNLSLSIVYLKKKFDIKKQNLQVSVSRFMSAWIVQRTFKRHYLNDFPVKSRFLARCKNLLVLYSVFTKSSFNHCNNQTLTKYFKRVYVISNPRISFQRMYKSAETIKTAWNNYHRRLSDVFDDVSILWDLIVGEIIAQRGRTKKKRSDATYEQIPLGIKNQIILEYVEEVKNTLISDILKGNKLVMLKYWPSDEKMISLIHSATHISLSRKRRKTKK